MVAIAAALQACQNRIASACNQAGRPENCAQLVAVSKTFPAASIRAAYDAGQRVFGESYLQEALAKMEQLTDLPLEWHFIGPLQSNKTRAIATNFAWVHSLERIKIAQRLSEQRPADLPPLNVCIQVNVSGEASKSGVEPDAALGLALEIVTLPHLRLRGFMAIPEPTQDAERLHQRFRQVAELLQTARVQPGLSGQTLDTLSMGMSDDLEAAIHEGATLVRVGTALFGSRNLIENNPLEQAQ